MASRTEGFLYERIYARLKADILRGRYVDGEGFPAERLLTERFHTTHVTVRHALSRLVHEGYLDRGSGRGTRVTIPGPRLTSVHAILRDLGRGNAGLLEGLEEQLRRVPLPLRVSFHRGDPRAEEALHEAALKDGALILLEPGSTPSSSLSPPRGRTALPRTIILGGPGFPPSVATAGVDEEEGAKAALRYLRDLGHEQVTLAYEEPGEPGSTVLDAYARAAGAPGPALLPVPLGAGSAGAALTRHFPLPSSPAALLCTSDMLAARIADGLRSCGRAPGHDASVIGWGDTPIAAALGLTSIEPGHGRLATLLMAPIAHALEHGEPPAGPWLVTPELRVRVSCARYQGGG